LTELDREVERRYESLGSLGEVRLNREIYAATMPLYVIIIDEVGNYTITYPNKKIGQAVVQMLSSIAAKGAGAGVLLILANQRVSVEFIPGKIRANISQRIAFRVADRIENDMVLGPGSAKKGYDASTISRGVEHRGIGYADIDGHRPVKFRADLVEFKDTLEIAKKAALVRGSVEPSLPASVDPEFTDDVDDILEDDVLVAERDLTADIRAVWKLNEERLHNSVILGRLKAAFSEYYGEWSAQLFGRRLRDAGLASYKRQWTEPGTDRVNHWGLYASALFAGDDGKDSKTERREREQAALDSLSEHERLLHEARVAELQNASACAYCHGMLGPDNPATVDHLIPLNAGGTSHAWNLVPACRSCNSSKRDKNVTEWLATRKAS
jgi:5-methylcytosine-specific restriction endonuclease McrA